MEETTPGRATSKTEEVQAKGDETENDDDQDGGHGDEPEGVLERSEPPENPEQRGRPLR